MKIETLLALIVNPKKIKMCDQHHNRIAPLPFLPTCCCFI